MSFFQIVFLILFIYFILTTLHYIFRIYPHFIKARQDFTSEEIKRDSVLQLVSENKESKKFIIQITTKGHEMEIIEGGLKSLDNIFKDIPSLLKIFSIEILTETKDDKRYIDNLKLSFDIKFVFVPNQYQTTNQSQYKARALHYMVEKRREQNRNDISSIYIIHFDAESVIKKEGLLTIIKNVYLADKSIYVLQGPIFYPRNWMNTGYFCRQMESLRPWNCYECYDSMKSGRPFHLHGSNLVIRGDIETKFGWDFGNVFDEPIVAEDLLFGIKIFLNYGNSVFKWHSAVLLEQPGLNILDSIRQRVRWVNGSLQTISLIQTWPEFKSKNKRFRRRFIYGLWFKIIIYSLGFIPSIILVVFIVTLLSGFITQLIGIIPFLYIDPKYLMGSDSSAIAMVPFWMQAVATIGAILWLLSIQIGLYHNLRYIDMSFKRRIIEHISILLITPFATVIDTGTAFFTTLKWILGDKGVSWEVTPKVVSAD